MRGLAARCRPAAVCGVLQLKFKYRLSRVRCEECNCGRGGKSRPSPAAAHATAASRAPGMQGAVSLPPNQCGSRRLALISGHNVHFRLQAGSTGANTGLRRKGAAHGHPTCRHPAHPAVNVHALPQRCPCLLPLLSCLSALMLQNRRENSIIERRGRAHLWAPLLRWQLVAGERLTGLQRAFLIAQKSGSSWVESRKEQMRGLIG